MLEFLVLVMFVLLMSVFLVIISLFENEEDAQSFADLLSLLPGTNCGFCGYPSCREYGDAVFSGKERNLDLCSPGGEKTAGELAIKCGIEKHKNAMSAKVRCAGGCDKTFVKYKYKGVKSCRSNVLFLGGHGECFFGCIGFGDCVKVCRHNAIYVSNGIATVDKELCVGCGLCVAECPKNLITITPTDKETMVLCSSTGKGNEVRKICGAGCVGCGLCEKHCAYDAAKVVHNLSAIDIEKCVDCGVCATVCTTNIIRAV